MSALWTGIIGIVGVLVGVLLNELVRRKNRREVFAPKIFEKRLAAYEELFKCMQECDSELQDLLNSKEALTEDEAHAHRSRLVFAVANFVDEHRLYLDDDIRGHCVFVFIGSEEMLNATGDVREKMKKRYGEILNDAYRMIAEDAGIAEVTKLFKSINRPKLSGPFIEGLQKWRREQRRK